MALHELVRDMLGAMRTFKTELIGAVHFKPELTGGPDFPEVSFDVRIAHDSSPQGGYFVVTGGMLGDTAFSSLEEAKVSVTTGKTRATWRASVDPEGEERSCFVCGAFAGNRLEARSRYPEDLCPVCIHEAVDERGRALRFTGGDPGAAVVVETGEPHRGPVCFVRGRKCWAKEAYFGGLVVVPFERGQG